MSGYAAATSSGSDEGTRTKFFAGATTYSAKLPFVSLPMIPNVAQSDSSPRRHAGHRPHHRLGFRTPRTPARRLTPRPTASTAPTTSDPPTWGIGISEPSIRIQTSRWFSALARTRRRTSPRLGSGAGSSPSSSTSGPPTWRKNTANMAGPGTRPHVLSVPVRTARCRIVIRSARTCTPRDGGIFQWRGAYRTASIAIHRARTQSITARGVIWTKPVATLSTNRTR